MKSSKSSSGMFHALPGGVKPTNRGTSAKTFAPVGSGSRPTRSTHGIESSAPADPYTMGRSVSGALKWR